MTQMAADKLNFLICGHLRHLRIILLLNNETDRMVGARITSPPCII